MRRERISTVVVIFLLTAAAFATRSLHPVDLFTDDPPYHLLRVERILAGLFSVEAPDPLVAWPRGAVAIWPSGFDWMVAAWARPLAGDSPDALDLAAACAPLPVLLGALLVPLAFLAGRKVTSTPRALLAAAIVAFLPAHVDYSLWGRVDHHVLEPLLPCLALAVAWGGGGGKWRHLASGLIAGSMLAFVPAAMPIALAVVAAVGLAATSRPGQRAALTGLGFACGTALSLPASPAPASWAFQSPSLLHLVLACATAAGLAAADIAATRWRPAPALATGGAAAALACICAALVSPGMPEEVRDGLAYLTSNEIAGLSLEASPLVSDLPRAATLLTWLFPLALAGSWMMLAGRDAAPERFSFGLLVLALAALAVVQRRFLVAFVPFFSIALAEGIDWCRETMTAWMDRKGVRRSLTIALQTVAAVAAVFPSVTHLATVSPVTATDKAVLQAARLPFAGVAGREGILTPWSYGHLFQFVAHAPTTCDNFFGTRSSDDALRTCLHILYETEIQRASALLAEHRVGRVVVAAPDPRQVRAEAGVIGIDPARFVTEGGFLTREFASTLWARLGLWGMGAREGETGPHGLRLAARMVVEGEASGAPESEVMVFDIP